MQVHSTDDYLNQLSIKFSDELKAIVYETRRRYPEIVETFARSKEFKFPSLLNQETNACVGLQEDQDTIKIYFNKTKVLTYLKEKYPHIRVGNDYISFDQLNDCFSAIINDGIQFNFNRKE